MVIQATKMAEPVARMVIKEAIMTLALAPAGSEKMHTSAATTARRPGWS